MTQREYRDPVIELALLIGGPEHVLDFADTNDEAAETLLAAIDEAEAEVRAGDIASRMRAQGLL